MRRRSREKLSRESFNSVVNEVMRISGFNGLLHVYGTEGEALAAF